MREDFERWYLQVVKGHPNNLAKDESGGYKYLAAMYLGWEAATLIEREACAALCDKTADTYEAQERFKFAEQRTDAATGAASCAMNIRMRSNAVLTGAEGVRLKT